jgi:hypothetical protein
MLAIASMLFLFAGCRPRFLLSGGRPSLGDYLPPLQTSCPFLHVDYFVFEMAVLILVVMYTQEGALHLQGDNRTTNIRTAIRKTQSNRHARRGRTFVRGVNSHQEKGGHPTTKTVGDIQQRGRACWQSQALATVSAAQAAGAKIFLNCSLFSAEQDVPPSGGAQGWARGQTGLSKTS